MWSINLHPKQKEYPMQEKKPVCSTNSVGKTGQLHANNETEPLSYTTHKNKLKMD